MNLGNGIDVLVRDWIDLHEQGGTKLSVDAVVKKLSVEKTQAIKTPANPSQIVVVIMERLRQIPGAQEIAEKFMAQFPTAEDLLDEMDLDSFVSDLETMEADDL